MLFSRLVRARAEARAAVIVAGDGGLAVTLARRVAAEAPTVLLALPAFQGQLPGEGTGFRVVRGSGVAAADLRAAGADRARALLAVAADPRANIALAETARAAYGVENILAAGDPQALPEAEARGVRLITAETSTVVLLAAAALAPGIFDLLGSGEDTRLEEVEARNPACANQPLSRCRLPAGVLAVGLRRGSDLLVPGGDTVLRLGDRVTLMGPPGEVAAVREMLAGG